MESVKQVIGFTTIERIGLVTEYSKYEGKLLISATEGKTVVSEALNPVPIGEKSFYVIDNASHAHITIQQDIKDKNTYTLTVKETQEFMSVEYKGIQQSDVIRDLSVEMKNNVSEEVEAFVS